MLFSRNKAAVFVQILFGDELFNFVDGDRIVYVAARTFAFALARANAAAYGRKRIFFADKLERFFVFSLRGEFNVTLNRNVRGASRFTRRRSRFDDVFAVFAVIRVPVLFRPNAVSGAFCFYLFKRRFGAQLLSEAKRVCRTVFDALTAGYAFIGFDL